MGNKKSKLSKGEQRAILDKTKFTESELKQLYKGYLQVADSNGLTHEAFHRLHGNVYGPPAYTKHVFKFFDKSRDGKLDFGEYAFAVNLWKNEPLERRMLMTFQMYDIDSSGFITKDELIEIMKCMQSEENQESAIAESANSIFCRLDTNNDGKLSQTEFSKGLRDEYENEIK